MLEKILFKKIELWILILVLILLLIGTIIFGWVVRHTTIGGERAGRIGEIAVSVASIPYTVKVLLFGKPLSENIYNPNKLASDSISKDVTTLYNLKLYKNVWPNAQNSPKYFIKKGAISQDPLAILARVNDSGEEVFSIFNKKREVVKILSNVVRSDEDKSSAKLGSSQFHFFNDGSYLIWTHGGAGLFRLNHCGEIIWQLSGIYHHHFSIADGKLYILGLPVSQLSTDDLKNWNHSDILNIIDIESGEILQSISIQEIAARNLPNIDPFFYERWKNTINPKGVLSHDFLHLNKIEVLPSKLREQYPDLPNEALLISARHINLLFIVDPKTLEINWFSHGNTQVQHDPRFIGNNMIAVFNNAFDKNHSKLQDPSNYSSIKVYDFTNKEWTTLYNMKPINGYTAHSGRFDISNDGSMAFELTLQGRVVEINPDHEPFFEFISYRDQNSVYWQKGIQYLSESAYESLISKQCR